jgi:hypothetical protein
MRPHAYRDIDRDIDTDASRSQGARLLGGR